MKAQTPAPAKRLRAQQQTRHRLTSEREKTVDLYVKGYITEAGFQQRAMAIDARLQELDSKPADATPVLSSEVMDAFVTVAQDWAYVPDSEKRGLLLQLEAHVIVNTTGISPAWLELRTVLNHKPIRVSGILRGRWGIQILP